jgi:hypothetical protein
VVIRLSVRRKVDLKAFESGITLLLYRIMADVRILTPTGWSAPVGGLIDTGNPVTILPRSVWIEASAQLLTRTSRSIHGLGSTDASAIQGRLGRVFLSFEHGEASSPPLETMAYLVDDDRSPLLLGCEGVLTRAILRANLAALEASLEF